MIPPALHAAGEAARDGSAWAAWSLDPLVLAPVALLGALYVRGLHAMGEGGRRAVPRAHAAAFLAGLAALALALTSPVDGLSGELLSVHMLQHVLLVSVAAPLLVVGSPAVVVARALPRGVRRRAGRATRPLLRLRLPRRSAATPFVALALSAAGLWAWHVPAAYEAAVRGAAPHAAEHATFLATALLFWWAVVGSGARAGPGPPVACCFLAALQSAGLGVLMVFSAGLWYPVYAETAPAWGLDAMEDQRLAGTLMWIPGGLVYAGAACLVLLRALRSRPRRAARGAGARA